MDNKICINPSYNKIILFVDIFLLSLLFFGLFQDSILINLIIVILILYFIFTIIKKIFLRICILKIDKTYFIEWKIFGVKYYSKTCTAFQFSIKFKERVRDTSLFIGDLRIPMYHNLIAEIGINYKYIIVPINNLELEKIKFWNEKN